MSDSAQGQGLNFAWASIKSSYELDQVIPTPGAIQLRIAVRCVRPGMVRVMGDDRGPETIEPVFERRLQMRRAVEYTSYNTHSFYHSCPTCGGTHHASGVATHMWSEWGDVPEVEA